MGIVVTASFITAFIAGVAALFAPCCIGVLLPSYLASIFKTKTKIFLMTFIYYLGMLTIFVPLGLGAAGLSSFFSSNHSTIFTAGGIFMVTLGIFSLLGKSVMLPFHVHPRLKQHDLGSIYVLGVFSGIATTCCAPILAGVLALSALPGSLWLGTLYAITFVTGMVLPLFTVAALVDRKDIITKFQSLKRRINYSLLGKQISASLSHVISGVIYLAFGLFILIFERTNPNVNSSSFQLQINIWAAKVTRWVSQFTEKLPQTLWAIIFLIIFISIGWAAYRQAASDLRSRKEKNV